LAASASLPEAVVPRTADGRVGWFEYLTPQVPSTADGAERWVTST
jgi:hypothetical protein